MGTLPQIPHRKEVIAMKIDLRNVTTKWINLDAATEKNEQMIELATKFGFTNASRVSAVSGIEPHEGVNNGE